MHSDIAALHKILKDKTRQKIITLLNQKDSLSYTELLEATQAGSTGLLNYHLKILGDLLVKNQEGQYQLSEKGKLSHKLIVEFPDVSNQAQKRRNQKVLLTVLGIGQIVYLSILLLFYFLGQLEFYRLITGFSSFIFGMIMLFIIYRLQLFSTPSPDSSEWTKRMKFAYVSGGISSFLLIAFFGVGILFRLISDLSGMPFTRGNPLYATLWSPAYMTFSMLIAPIIGGLIFYYWGKRNGFRRPKWAIWVDSHFNIN